jgi:hypothetical protein
MIGLDNVGVDQVGHEPGLANEVLLKLLDARILLTYQLDGNKFMEIARTVLVSLVDNSHAAFGNLPEQLVVELVENKLQGSHADIEAYSTAAGKCADAHLAWKLL